MRSHARRTAAAGATAVAVLAGGWGTAFAASTPTPTTLTIKASTTGSSTVALPITGSLKAGTKGLGLQVVRLVGELAGATTFKTLGYVKTDPTGAVKFSVKPPKGKDVYELVYNGSKLTNPAYSGSHSKTVTVTVSK